MDNKTFGLTFSAIFSSALLVFGAANAGAYAVDKWVFPTATYGERTYIGTTDVSNMEIVTAKNLFSGQVASWRETSELIVTYQDETALYPLETAEILLDETVHQAESGSRNGFIYQLSPVTTQSFLEQHFPAAHFSDADVEGINSKLEEALGAGQLQTRVSIGEDSLMIPKETVAEVVFPQSFETQGAQQVIAALNGMQLPPETQFSFLEFIEQTAPAAVTDDELTEIASALYGLVIRTNLLVDERSIGSAVPASTPVGQEAAINRALGIDLKFTNPNASSFTVQMDASGNSLYASLTGQPLIYTYEIQSGAEQTVRPRLIKQYSAFVASGSIVQEEGRDGIRLQVNRTISADHLEIAVEEVSTDFYPPVHRVEVLALAAAAAEPAADENPDDPALPADENGDPSVNPIQPGEADGTETDPESTGSGSPDGKNSEDPNQHTDKEPTYDKGGNEVNP